MIKLMILSAILAVTQARSLKKCDGAIIINNLKYEQEVLNSVDSPYQLAIDYATNTLFFSYTTKPGDEEVFQSANINLNTNEFATIAGIEGGFANAVDSKKHIVYLGGRDGIFNFNYQAKKAEHVATDKNIWQLFYKDNLYYTTYPEEEAYMYKDGESKRVPELSDTKAMLIALDNDDNIYFTNSSGLFLHEASNGHVTLVGNYTLNCLTADKDGNLFFSTLEELYRIDSDTKNVELLTSFEYVYGMAIEANGNIIYASETSLNRLKPTKTHCKNNRNKLSV